MGDQLFTPGQDEWIVIRKWETFQHYKDRNVPWIKTYTELLHDEAYLRLPPGTRSLLHGLWLVYVSSHCRLPLDTRWITRQLNQRCTRQQLMALVHAGFVEISSRPNLDHVQMESRRSRAREEEEKERDKPRAVNEARSQGLNGNGLEIESPFKNLTKDMP